MLLALSAVEQTIQDKTRFHYYDDSDDINRVKRNDRI